MKNVVFFLFLSFWACTQPAASQTEIDAAGLETMLQKNPATQLLDVRTPAELAKTGRIEGAKHMDFNSPDFRAQLETLDKSKPVIVYCASGGRSPRTAVLLSKMGFGKVFDYAGGMNDWLAKGKKTVK